MTCFKRHIMILESMHFEEENVEATMTKIIIRELHISILNIYAAPSATLANILKILTKSLCNMPLNERIIIIGDLNVDMLQSNNKTKSLENYMSSYNLHFLLDKKDHLATSLIDHLWSNITNKYKIFKLDTHWSEHDTICLVLNNSNTNES